MTGNRVDPTATGVSAALFAATLGLVGCGAAGAYKTPPDGVQQNEASRCKKDALPAFPWPAPTPSARMAMPDDLTAAARARPAPTLKDAADALDALMVSAGYSQRAYFRLEEDKQSIGFALVTRMERIHQDGEPYPPEQRFLPAGAPDQFDVVSFLKSLFVAPVGFYRVIVLTVARAPVDTSGAPMDEAAADALLNEGGSRLVGCVAAQPYTDEYAVDALIYEFRHAPEESASPDEAVSQLKPSHLGPGIHLRKAGILAAPPR